MAATAFPRTIVKLSLHGVRVPLSVAERLARRSGVDIGGSRAVAVYDSIEAEAKKALGRILHDEQLVMEGERQAKTVRYRQSIVPTQTAPAWDLREDEAPSEEGTGSLSEGVRVPDRGADGRSDVSDDSPEEIHRRTEERLAELQREEEQAKHEARQRALKLEEAARQAASAREKAEEAKARQEELAHGQPDTGVGNSSDKADDEKVVTSIDEHLDARGAGRRRKSNP